VPPWCRPHFAACLTSPTIVRHFGRPCPRGCEKGTTLSKGFQRFAKRHYFRRNRYRVAASSLRLRVAFKIEAQHQLAMAANASHWVPLSLDKRILLTAIPQGLPSNREEAARGQNEREDQRVNSGNSAASAAKPYTDLISRYSSKPKTPIERPIPDCL
jgi:hypothetical protein